MKNSTAIGVLGLAFAGVGIVWAAARSFGPVAGSAACIGFGCLGWLAAKVEGMEEG